jgi:hypothetical protein
MGKLKADRKRTFSAEHIDRFRQKIAESWDETLTIVKIRTKNS